MRYLNQKKFVSYKSYSFIHSVSIQRLFSKDQQTYFVLQISQAELLNIIMHIKYNFNLCLTQTIIILLVINSITANLLKKNTEITLAGK